MTEETERTDPARPPLPPGVHRPLPDHPVRIALLDLLADAGTATATGAAARLGLSSGLCSFHLRQLARYGLVEEIPERTGRSRPWRLRWEAGTPVRPADPADPADSAVTALARGLTREPAALPAEPFTAVLHLTPAEAAELDAAVRSLCARHAARTRRPPGTAPYAVAARILPLLPD